MASIKEITNVGWEHQGGTQFLADIDGGQILMSLVSGNNEPEKWQYVWIGDDGSQREADDTIIRSPQSAKDFCLEMGDEPIW